MLLTDTFQQTQIRLSGHLRSGFSALRLMAAEHPIRVRISGDCMAPYVSDGALVDVGGPARLYWPGDVVVVLLDGNRLALHRVIGAYRRAGAWKVLTQGDTAQRPDTAVRADRILGRARGGDCDRSLIEIPLRHRLRAAGRFVRFALVRLGRGVRA